MTDRVKGAVGIEGEEIIIHGSRYQEKERGACIGIAGRKMADKRARWLVLEYLKGEVGLSQMEIHSIEQVDEEVLLKEHGLVAHPHADGKGLVTSPVNETAVRSVPLVSISKSWLCCDPLPERGKGMDGAGVGVSGIKVADDGTGW